MALPAEAQSIKKLLRCALAEVEAGRYISAVTTIEDAGRKAKTQAKYATR